MSLTNRIIVEGENTWGCKSGWLDVDNVKQALKDYIKKKAELFKLYRKGKINLNLLRIKLIESEKEIFGKDLLE